MKNKFIKLTLLLSVCAPALTVNAMQQNENNQTSNPLHWVAETGDLNSFRSLLNKGANPLEVDSEGNTTLHTAIIKKQEAIARYLIEEVKIDLNIQNKQGETALILAAKNNLFTTVQLLLQNRADANIADTKNLLPLYHALDQEHFNTAYEFIKLINLKALKLLVDNNIITITNFDQNKQTYTYTIRLRDLHDYLLMTCNKPGYKINFYKNQTLKLINKSKRGNYAKNILILTQNPLLISESKNKYANSSLLNRAYSNNTKYFDLITMHNLFRKQDITIFKESLIKNNQFICLQKKEIEDKLKKNGISRSNDEFEMKENLAVLQEKNKFNLSDITFL